MKNKYISPEIVDIHLYGGGAADALDVIVEAIETIVITHAKHGTTSIVPSFASPVSEKMLKALAPQPLKLLYKIKRANKKGICTDLWSTTCMPGGKYSLADLERIVEDGVPILAHRNLFTDSVYTVGRDLRTIYRLSDIPLVDTGKCLHI